MQTTRPLSLALALLALLLLPALSSSAADQTQHLSLSRHPSQPTWHAVWLYVEPTHTPTGEDNNLSGAPALVEEVFDDPSIQLVASPVRPVGTAEFVSNQTGDFNPSTWAVWRRDDSSVDNSLMRVRGHRAYLVKLAPGSTPLSLSITGRASFSPPEWAPAAYSLVGFQVTGHLTFDELFSASNGIHPVNRILRLDPATGAWTHDVLGTDTVEDGTAYYIFSQRSSSYMGPVSVLFDGTDSLPFGPGPGRVAVPDPDPGASVGDSILVSLKELTLTNVGTSPSPEISLHKLSPTTTGGDAVADALRLYQIVPRQQSLDHTIGGAGQITDWSIEPIAPTTTKTVTIGAHRNWTDGARSRENLYHLHVGNLAYWLPVNATNAHLTGGATTTQNTTSAGLWVGAISLNEVTSLTEAGRPLRPAKTTAPLRIILHAAADGTVSLLSHVLFMNTKTADPDVPPETVLVVDETKIPFFQGIEQRDGKRIGQRIETIGFDMPQDLTNPGTYHHSWPLDGTLAGDALVNTHGDAPLTLDPRHRSNPFRHAYHARHSEGFQIGRHLTLSFDTQSDPDLLTGIYQETLTGPTAVPITMRGPVTLRRISDISELQ